MARGRTNPALIVRLDGSGGRRRVPAKLLVEEAMDIRLEEQLVTTVLRTPGHDYELAVGHLFGEGHIGGGTVHEVRYCATGSAVDTGFNVVSVGVGGRTSAVASADAAARPSPATALDVVLLAAAVEALARGRELHRLSGGAASAAAVVDRAGAMTVLREDVDPCNAVDKVVGRLHLDRRLPASDDVLYVTGVVTATIVARAARAGFGGVVAEGPATSAAVDAATAAGITLAGDHGTDGWVLYGEPPGR